MSKNWFNELNADTTGMEARLAVDDDQKFEEGQVRFTLQKFKLQFYARQMVEQERQQNGSNYLKFAIFNEMFPSFPFIMGASRLRNLPIIRNGRTLAKTPVDYEVHRDSASTEPARFKNFGRVPFQCAYQYFYDKASTDDDGRKVCLTFPRKGFLRGMCIHNDSSEEHWTSGLSWVYKMPNGSRIYVQPYSALLDAIHKNGRGWRPD